MNPAEDIAWIKHTEVRFASFIGQNTLAVGYENIINFLNIKTGSELYYRAGGSSCVKDIGDGISCLACHIFYDIFAYAELCSQPRIFIYSFPKFRHIGTLKKQNSERYLAIEFSETEHLIALTSLPSYLIEIWNWRTGKLLAVQSTELYSDIQILKVSRSLPLTCTQLAISDGRLIFWEIYVSVDTASLIRRTVKIPINESVTNQKFDITYSIDGTLFVVNKFGTVWHINPASNKINEIIKYTAEQDATSLISLITLYKNGLIVIGPDSGSVKYFKKNGNLWCEIWTLLQSNFKIISLVSYGQDKLVAITENGIIVNVEEESETVGKLSIVKKCDRSFKFFTIVNPAAEYMVTINQFDELNLLSLESGNQISSVNTPKVSCILAHPLLPVVALGHNDGTVHLLSIYDIQNLKILTKFYITTFLIRYMKFSESGTTLIVVDENSDIFVIRGSIGQIMKITNHIILDWDLFSLTINEVDLIVYINALSLPKLSIKSQNDQEQDIYYSNQMLQIQLKRDNSTEIQIVNLPKNYVSIEPLNKTKLIAIPYLCKTFDIFDIDRTNPELICNLLKTLQTPHNLNYFQMKSYEDFIISWSIDGAVFLWNANPLETVENYQAHSQYLLGVKDVVCDPFKRYIVSLGNSLTLLCIKLKRTNGESTNKLQIKSFESFFAQKTIGFEPIGQDKGKTWVQIEADKVQRLERQIYLKEREDILEKVNILKENLKVLIDSNGQCEPEEKLSINEFNLDVNGCQQLFDLARLERENEEKDIQENCIEQNRITDWIKANTWNLMDVKGARLRGIFTKLNVENYALIKMKTNLQDDLDKIVALRSSEQIVSENDVFEPWQIVDTNSMNLMISHLPGYTKETKNSNVLENKYSLTGSSSHLYIKPFPYRYNQMEVVTYQQMISEDIMGFHDTLELRKYFNKIFDKMMATKDYEMNLVKKRNARLRYIQDELNKLEKLKKSNVIYAKVIIDPQYEPDEQPKNIVKVEDDEISVSPYISPSEQKILDDKAADEERRRLELLADDFRDRALVKMMDGVLEIHWEDEIKKSPPLPLCMCSKKDPKDYTVEDLNEIQHYEMQVKTLEMERAKYGKMLMEEKLRIEATLEEQIQRFNFKVGETLLQKMRIEFAISCEDLKLLRNELYNFQRLQLLRKEKQIHFEMKELRQEIDGLTKLLNTLEELYLNCKAKYEELSARDRLYDKQFKTTFSEYAAQAVVDQASRVYKRRPKWQMRAWQTGAILQDMAKRVNLADTSETGPPLPEECFTYLHLLDQIEKFSNAPNLMDQHLWQILCKMRRSNVELEFRVKSYGALMAESEATVNAFSKEINLKKLKLTQYDKKLEELKEKQSQHLINRSVQLCVKRGIVEIPLSGRISDFHNSILLHSSDVFDINEIIKKAGMIKLKTMENAAIFRRKIIYKEWEHKVLRTKIKDKKNLILLIEKCKITKEVQTYLKRKQLKLPSAAEDNDGTSESEGLAATTKSLENMCSEIIKKIEANEDLICKQKIQNFNLDRNIQNLNLYVSEQNQLRDIDLEEEEIKRKKERMHMMVERSRLVKKVQQQHGKILELTTMLELQRLRTYPTLNLNASLSTGGK